MSPHWRQRRIFLFVVAIIVPSLALTLLGLRLIGQERELAEKRLVEDQRRWASDIRHSPSPDGRYLCYRDGKTADLGVRELGSGEKRKLTTNLSSPPEARGVPQFPIFSPDSRQIAYDWRKQDRSHELRIIRLDGSGMRILYRHEEVIEIQPAEWSADGRHILALVRRKDRVNQIALIAVTDGSTRTLKTLDWRSPGKMSLSPDGRYVAYDFFPPQGGDSALDIFLLATDDGKEIQLINHPAHDRLLGWAPDGERILFGSDRTGTMGAWAIQVVGGQPQGTPELVKPDLGRIFPMGFTRKGAYYYGMEIVSNEPFIATLDLPTGRLLAPATPIKRSSHGPFASPNWTSDGQYLVYGSVRALTPWKPGSDILNIRSIASGKERELAPALSYFGGCRWAPDGRSILAGGIESSGARGLYRIDANTGEVTTLLLTDPKTSWIQQAEWFPDGKAIVYGWENRILLRDLGAGREKELYRGSFRAFALSPDGQQLAVALAQVLKVVPTSGGEPRELLTVQRPEGVTTVAWSPDGRQLLFGRDNVAKQGLATDLWRISAEGGEPQKLELTVEGMRELRMHPDGRQIAFSSFRLRREVWALENFLPASRASKTSARRR